MAPAPAHRRLTREYATLAQSPPPYIIAHPSEANILEWHYILTGPPDTPYAGGQYWGTLIFPDSYPFAPPAIRMYTPSGRFQPSTRLCLSISDFHPRSFNPAWSVSTILIGLLSFMASDEMTTGSLSASKRERELLAARSRWWNSTGGGSATGPPAGTTGATGEKKGKGPAIAAIKAGDGGAKFRLEWPDDDKENWEWMKQNRIDYATGRILPDPEGESVQCTPEAAKLRHILGGGNAASGGDLGRMARGGLQGWINGRGKWWLGAAFLIYVVVSRVLMWGGEGAAGHGEV